MVDEESAKRSMLGLEGLSITDQCKILKVSRSGYYLWKNRKSIEDILDTEAMKEKTEREMKLVKDVLNAFMEHSAFGYRKMSEY